MTVPEGVLLLNGLVASGAIVAILAILASRIEEHIEVQDVRVQARTIRNRHDRRMAELRRLRTADSDAYPLPAPVDDAADAPPLAAAA